MKTLALVLALAASASLAVHADDYSKVNGSIRVKAGQTAGDVDTVNGSIHIEDGVRAADVETVNGSVAVGANAAVERIETVNGRVSLGEGARADAVDTVNGAVTLAANVQVSGLVSTVNGSVDLATGASAGGDVESVNGHIELQRAEVGGGLRTTNGDITVGAGSKVRGGIVVEKPGFRLFSRNTRTPRIVIGPDAVVDGALKFEREVELYVHTSAKVGPIEGANAIPFSGATPGREDKRAAEQAVEK